MSLSFLILANATMSLVNLSILVMGQSVIIKQMKSMKNNVEDED